MLFDKEYAESKIHMLSNWIDRIDKVLASYLPMKVEVKETKVKGVYKYVTKPFLKSGKPSASTDNWYGDLSDSVSGPFSRVCFRPVNLDSNQED